MGAYPIPKELIDQLNAADNAHEINLILKSNDAAPYTSQIQIITDHKKPLRFFKFKKIKRMHLQQLKKTHENTYYLIEIDHWQALDIAEFKSKFQHANGSVVLLSKKLTVEETDDDYDPGHTLTQFLDGLNAKIISPNSDSAMLEGAIDPQKLSFPNAKSIKLNHVSFITDNELQIPNLANLIIRETEQSVLDSFNLSALESLDVIIHDEATEEYEPTSHLIGDVKYAFKRKTFDGLIWGNFRNFSKLEDLSFPKVQNLLILSVKDTDDQVPLIKNINAPELTELTIEFNGQFPLIENFHAPKLKAIRVSSIFKEENKDHTITLNEKSLEQFRNITHWELYSGAKLASLIKDEVEELNLTVLTKEDEYALVDVGFRRLNKFNLDISRAVGVIPIGAGPIVKDLSITFPETKGSLSNIDSKFPSVRKLTINDLSSKSIKALKPIKFPHLETLELNNTIKDIDDLSILKKLITTNLINLHIEIDPSESIFFELKSKSPLRNIIFRNISEFPQELKISSIPSLKSLKVRGFHLIALSKVPNLKELISEPDCIVGSIIADDLSNLEALEYVSAASDDVEDIKKINANVTRKITQINIGSDLEDADEHEGGISGGNFEDAFSVNSSSGIINMDDIEEEY